MKKFILVICCALMTGFAGLAQDISGTWNGVLEISGTRLRIAFNVEGSPGAYTATMDSPDQGAKGIPVNSIVFENGTLTIRMPEIGMKYEGTLQEGVISGTLEQGGGKLPLVLEKGEEVVINRPQTPTPPYPYRSEEVTFRNPEAGITLAGTLTYPAKGSGFAAVVLLTGSGPQNRDEEIFEHKPFLVIADYLTRNGIAVLRFDDRGTASSQGDYGSATIQDFATDAAAAMDFLKGRKEINADKIGLMGHSEGGQIAFITAARRPGVAFIVTLAGPGVKGEELMKTQRRLIGKAHGVSEAAMDANEQLVESMIAVLNKYGTGNFESDLPVMVQEIKSSLPPYMLQIPNVDNLIESELAKMGPEIMSLMAYDPASDLAVIRVPILALNGAEDLQVEADQNLGGIRERFSGDLTIKKYPGLNHLFQHVEGTNLLNYGEIEETISPQVLRDMAEWIRLKTK